MPPARPYTVRRASDTEEDLLSVLRLIEHEPELPLGNVTEGHQSMWMRMINTPDLTVYIAEREQKAVGTTSLLVMPHMTYNCRPTAFIEPMVVADAHRRRGVARMMTERVLHDARALHCHKVQLLSHKRHAEDGAHEFYRSLGFVAEAEGFRLYL